MIAFCFFIFFCTPIKAQKNIRLNCKLEKNIDIEKPSLNGLIETFFSPPFLFYATDLEWDDEKRKLKIYYINTTTNKKDSLLINIPQTIIINSLPKFALNENFLILTDDEEFDLYRFQKIKDKYLFKNKITLPPNSDVKKISHLSNNRFLFQSINNFHPDDNKINSNLGIYDADSDKIINFIHPDLPCIGFSHFPNSWVTFNSQMIAVANPCGYKINFYDYNLKAIDSIDYNPHDEWKNLENNRIPFETDPSIVHIKRLIDNLLILQDTISRIERIFFIDNSKLLVSSLENFNGKSQRRIDIWKINDWKKPATTFSAKTKYRDEEIVDLKNYILPLNNTDNVEITNNTIYIIDDEDYFPVNNISWKEYKHQKDLYYEKHDPQYSISIFSINKY